MVNVLPPAVYPVPDASFVVLYAVVAAFRVASEVYKAIFTHIITSKSHYLYFFPILPRSISVST